MKANLRLVPQVPECERSHMTSAGRQVVNVAKALVWARLRYRATKFDSKEEARALVLVVRHECALDRAIDSLEAEEKREKVNRG